MKEGKMVPMNGGLDGPAGSLKLFGEEKYSYNKNPK
jgi:hypothetical protein